MLDERRDEFTNRMEALRFSPQSIENTFAHWAPEDIEQMLDLREKLTFGSLRGRPISWSDGESFSDLWRNSPEVIGDWEVIVEREPFAFAQYMLHENFSIRVVEDRGHILGCGVLSFLNAYVAAQPMSIRVLSGWRVRSDSRGMNITRMFNHIAEPPTSRFWRGQFFYVRWDNQAAEQWMDAYSPGFLERTKKHDERPPGDVAEVLQYPARAFAGADAGIRPARREDLAQCVRLINRTHKGLDLFRPYTEEFLGTKLDEWSWSADKPEWFTHVYWWPDFHVVERDGRIVACGGLWDKGAHVREIWRHKQHDQRRTISTSCLMDFGFARDAADDMARLIEYFAGRTHELGRDFLLAPVQYLPAVAKRLTHLEPVPEPRGITWLIQRPEGGWMYPVDPALGRAYVDLAYW